MIGEWSSMKWRSVAAWGKNKFKEATQQCFVSSCASDMGAMLSHQWMCSMMCLVKTLKDLMHQAWCFVANKWCVSTKSHKLFHNQFHSTVCAHAAKKNVSTRSNWWWCVFSLPCLMFVCTQLMLKMMNWLPSVMCENSCRCLGKHVWHKNDNTSSSQTLNQLANPSFLRGAFVGASENQWNFSILLVQCLGLCFIC